MELLIRATYRRVGSPVIYVRVDQDDTDDGRRCRHCWREWEHAPHCWIAEHEQTAPIPHGQQCRSCLAYVTHDPWCQLEAWRKHDELAEPRAVLDRPDLMEDEQRAGACLFCGEPTSLCHCAASHWEDFEQ